MQHIAFRATGEISTPGKRADQDWKKWWSAKKLCQKVSKGLFILSVGFYWNWHRFPPVVRRNCRNYKVIPLNRQAVYNSDATHPWCSFWLTYLRKKWYTWRLKYVWKKTNKYHRCVISIQLATMGTENLQVYFVLRLFTIRKFCITFFYHVSILLIWNNFNLSTDK